MSKLTRGRVALLLSLILVLALFLTLAACQQAPPPQPPDTRAADEQAIRALNDDMRKAFDAGDAAKCGSLYAEDALGMAAGLPLFQGRAGMQKWYEGAIQQKMKVTWTLEKVEMARSGELAYSWGPGAYTVTDKKGKPVKTTYKNVSVYKKQADGTWKVAVDTMIPDPPAKPETSPAKK